MRPRFAASILKRLASGAAWDLSFQQVFQRMQVGLNSPLRDGRKNWVRELEQASGLALCQKAESRPLVGSLKAKLALPLERTGERSGRELAVRVVLSAVTSILRPKNFAIDFILEPTPMGPLPSRLASNTLEDHSG